MINYELLGKAVDFYSARGYKNVDVPWIVSAEASASTKPAGAPDLRVSGYEFGVEGDVLPASGEQGFVHRMLNGEFGDEEKLQTVTPCWRQEDHYSAYTRPYFMKLELFRKTSAGLFAEMALSDVLHDAFEFFAKTCKSRSELAVVKTDIGRDILYRSCEIGSYGIRTYKQFTWVYGTGLALPRFTTLL